MSIVFTLDSWNRDRALEEAADERAIVTLTRHDGEAWDTLKARCRYASAAQRYLVLEYPPPSADAPIPPAIRPGENVGVSFRRGHKKCVFMAVVAASGPLRLPDGRRLDGLRLSWPEEIQELQRRVYYRAKVPANREVPVHIWRGGRQRIGVEPATCAGRLVDISVGGVRLQVSALWARMLRDGERVGLRFQPDLHGPFLMLDGVCRHAESGPDGSAFVGVQFVGLDIRADEKETLQQLIRVVIQFQRYEEQQARLTAARSAAPRSGVDERSLHK